MLTNCLYSGKKPSFSFVVWLFVPFLCLLCFFYCHLERSAVIGVCDSAGGVVCRVIIVRGGHMNQ
jgi:hypothetical protein